jgi:hypothetical protein
MSAPAMADIATCATCRVVFASVELFDRHRQPTRTRSRCKPPETLGLVPRGGVWHLAPMSPVDRRARWAALREES